MYNNTPALMCGGIIIQTEPITLGIITAFIYDSVFTINEKSIYPFPSVVNTSFKAGEYAMVVF